MTAISLRRAAATIVFAIVFAIVSAGVLAGCSAAVGGGLGGSLAASELAAGKAALTSTAPSTSRPTAALPTYTGPACPPAVAEKTRESLAGKGTATVENFSSIGGPAPDPALIAGDTPSCVLRITEGAVSLDEYLFIGMDQRYADAFVDQLNVDGFRQQADNRSATVRQTEFTNGGMLVQVLYYPTSTPLTIVQSTH